METSHLGTNLDRNFLCTLLTFYGMIDSLIGDRLVVQEIFKVNLQNQRVLYLTAVKRLGACFILYFF